jgi:hypothetical protein
MRRDDPKDALPRLGFVLDRYAEQHDVAQETSSVYGGRSVPRSSRKARLALAASAAGVLIAVVAAVALRAPTDVPRAAMPSADPEPIVAVLPPPEWLKIDEQRVEPSGSARSQGALLASPAGDPEESVMVEIFREAMTDEAEAPVVRVGDLEGFYLADETSGTSVLILGNDRARVEMSASTRFSQAQLEDLAAQVDPALPAGEQDLGQRWKVVVAEATSPSRVVRSYSAQPDETHGRVTIRNFSTDHESDLWLVGGAHLAQDQTVRGEPGLAHHDPLTGTVRLAWLEAPNLIIELAYQSNSDDPVQEATRLAASLVTATEAQWERFVG